MEIDTNPDYQGPPLKTGQRWIYTDEFNTYINEVTININDGVIIQVLKGNSFKVGKLDSMYGAGRPNKDHKKWSWYYLKGQDKV
jgi:hypothetical protein